MDVQGSSPGVATNGNGHASEAEEKAAEGQPESAAQVFRRLTERPADLLRFATAGSVDDGKSTLIGRLLYDSKQVLSDQLAHVEEASQRRGQDFLDLSLLTDGLRAEREQGITIDVAYRYFSTPRRKFILGDTPGHAQYTRNMATGASTADVGIVLVDARLGVLPQSRRHLATAALLGIPKLAVCINKLDLVGFDRGVYERISAEARAFGARVIARALPDLEKARAPVELQRRPIAVVDFEKDARDPECGEPSEMAREQRARYPLSAQGGGDRDGEDFRFISGAAREHESGRCFAVSRARDMGDHGLVH